MFLVSIPAPKFKAKVRVKRKLPCGRYALKLSDGRYQHPDGYICVVDHTGALVREEEDDPG